MYEMLGREFSCKKYREGAVMKNYFDKLDKKISHYKNKYPTKPRKVAMKLALWNAKCVFKKHETLKFNEETQNKNFPIYNTNTLKTNTLKIAFLAGGGIGDIILDAVYISKFMEKLDIASNIYSFVEQSVKSITSLLSGIYDNSIYDRIDYHEEDFDVIIDLSWQFPKLICQKGLTSCIRSSF